MDPKKTSKRLWLRYVVAVALIALGMGLRIWPLSGLGLRIPYVTFYPAVMAAAGGRITQTGASLALWTVRRKSRKS